MLQAMNQRIEHLFDRDHAIGHAYFMGIKSLETLEQVFRQQIIPLLQEYFYGDWGKLQLVFHDLVGSDSALHPDAIIEHVVQDPRKVLGVDDDTYARRLSYEVSEEMSAASFQKIYDEP
jgi:5-methylcytosine-specific restriction protein B